MADPVVIVEDDITIIETATETSQVLIDSDEPEFVIAAADQGPAGPPGAAGGTLDIVAATSLSGHRVVVPDALGNVIYADSADITHLNKVIGVTLGAAIGGDTLTVRRIGTIVEPSWSWTLDQPIFLGVGGGLTQTQPIYPTALFSQIIGFPVKATEMFVSPREPILLT